MKKKWIGFDFLVGLVYSSSLLYWFFCKRMDDMLSGDHSVHMRGVSSLAPLISCPKGMVLWVA